MAFYEGVALPIIDISYPKVWLLRNPVYPSDFLFIQQDSSMKIGVVLPIPSLYTLPDSKYIYNGVNRGDGVAGTLNASNIAEAAGSGSNLSSGVLQKDTVVDDVTGTMKGGTMNSILFRRS